MRLPADSPPETNRSPLAATAVPGIGVPLGEGAGDILAERRVIDRGLIARTSARTFRDLLARVKDVELVITPGPGGDYSVAGGWDGGAKGCGMFIVWTKYP